ncbi:MAG: hypothetical protein ACRDZO_18630 [Egibacteraceae bacterium]
MKRLAVRAVAWAIAPIFLVGITFSAVSQPIPIPREVEAAVQVDLDL